MQNDCCPKTRTAITVAVICAALLIRWAVTGHLRSPTSAERNAVKAGSDESSDGASVAASATADSAGEHVAAGEHTAEGEHAGESPPSATDAGSGAPDSGGED